MNYNTKARLRDTILIVAITSTLSACNSIDESDGKKSQAVSRSFQNAPNNSNVRWQNVRDLRGNALPSQGILIDNREIQSYDGSGTEMQSV